MRALMDLVLVCLLILLACIGAGGCATATGVTPLSEQERCARFSGKWEAGACRSGSGGGP